MPKRARATGNPGIHLDQHAATPLYRQVYERLREQILAGQIQAGARLPSTRGLAAELGVSRTTTTLTYQMLLLEGYIESRVGDGARVARLGQAPRPPDQPGRSATVGAPVAPTVADLAAAARSPAAAAGAEPAAAGYTDRYGPRQVRPFSSGVPEVAHFPWEAWARLVARHARHSLAPVAQTLAAAGYRPLREAIANHTAITRGVRCTADDVIITAGSQGALHLIAQTVLAPGTPVWLEDPGYPGARGAVRATGATVVPVPVDANGLDVEAGLRLCPGARLVVVTPSHQFPTGETMSLDRRLALLRWAATARAWIVEDDYDSEYRYCGRPLEALQGLDQAQRVVYVGTFSKTLFPALRVGYLVAPAELRQRLLATRTLIDTYHPALEQMALADFLTEGHHARHIRRMRGCYRERRDALVAALAHELGDALDARAPEAGLHLVGWLRSPVAARRVASLDLGIELVSRYASRPLPRDGLVLGFATPSLEEINRGVAGLARALTAV